MRVISDTHIRQIVELYTGFEETEHSKIYSNKPFSAIRRVTVERPLIEKQEILGDGNRSRCHGQEEAIRNRIPALRDYERDASHGRY